MNNIRPKPSDMKSLRLSPEEGFVLSRVDGPTSVKELVSLTGLDEGRVVEIVGRLASEGALDVEGLAPPSAPPAAATATATLPARARRADDEEEEADAAAPPPESSPALDDDDKEDEETIARAANEERNYRKIYETLYHPMEREGRIAAAQREDGGNLCALCLDADPQIIGAILTNPRFGFENARLIAQHHKTSVGLDMLGRRSEILRDAGVQRKLFANPMVPDVILNKLINPKLLMEVYKIGINREYPERTRNKTREILNKKFMLASSDERAALLVKTEGRCLVQLINVALDARATQILCARTSYTILFVQNLARWSATPPALIAHLIKQPVVRPNVGLRKMLLKHPNCPSETKRNFHV